MKQLVESIVNKNFDNANYAISEAFQYIIERKMIEKKKMIMAERNAWNGMPGSRQEKLYRDVLEEEPEDGEESSMARSELNAITKNAKSIMSKIKGNKELEAWTQSKITKAADYLNSVADYMDEPIEEQLGGSPLNAGLAAPKSSNQTPSGKGDFGSAAPSSSSQNVNDVETDNLIKKNTAYLANKREIHKTILKKLGFNVDDYDNQSPLSIHREETEKLEEARVKLIKARIRGGKIQRRKKVSNIPGMTLRGGQLKRMSAAERRHRKLGQRKGKLKRKAKMARTLMKRQRSLRKRQSLGL